MNDFPRLSTLNERYEADRRRRANLEYLRCLALHEPSDLGPLDALEQKLGAGSQEFQRIKAAVDPLSGTNASQLTPTPLWRDTVEQVRRETVLGQLATIRAAVRTRTPIFTGRPTASWTAWSSPIPVVEMTLTDAASEPTGIGFIVGFSREWLRHSGDRGLSNMERAIVDGVKVNEDEFLLDAEAAVSGQRPAGLLAGLSAVGGGSPDAVDEDLVALWGAVRGGDSVRPAFICSPTGAMYLAGLDLPMFRNVSPVGGQIAGVTQLATAAADNRLILVDANSVIVADEGLSIESSNYSALHMDTSPSSPSSLVSAFQTGTRFLRVQRLIWWALAHTDGAAFINLPI